MGRSVAPILADILDRIDKIQSATKGKAFESFDSDWLLRFAVERGIENISEAVRHLPEELLSTQPGLPWPMIRGIGNVLRHEYHRIAPKVIWGVVTLHLTPLRKAIVELQVHLATSDKGKRAREPA